MRVISGKAGGLKLLTPKGINTRPTADRIKEALFSILEHNGLLQNATVLDLFAGSGALGIEALSRGAKTCCFVDKNHQSVAAIRANLHHTGFSDLATLLELDAEKAVKFLAGQNNRFNLIFLDPPYHNDLKNDFLRQLADKLCTPGSIVVFETSGRNKQADSYSFGKLYDRRDYGDTSILFYLVEENNDL